ncbi:MAG: DUF72 domain-containing protein [Candidatus Hydrogenedentes bacterium]|nr:DUF72 domain-containing protein [Candidatus Hydrogenedentota bacterium]
MTWQDSLLRLGACSWTAKGWERAFYQRAKRPTDFIAEYAQRYSTVEIDASFYALPKPETVEYWRDSTPDGFVFAAKMPQVITHQKFLEGCGDDLQRSLDTFSLFGEKLGPLLFQFPYFAKAQGVELSSFLRRFLQFSSLLPKAGFQFAVEVRNKTWISQPLIDLFHEHNLALALIDHPWMAPPGQLFRQQGIVTGPFLYVRWLGDRKGIEKMTTVWDKTVIDRTRDMERWAPPIKEVLDRGVRVYGYVNNHYSGYAPADIEFLAQALK